MKNLVKPIVPTQSMDINNLKSSRKPSWMKSKLRWMNSLLKWIRSFMSQMTPEEVKYWEMK